MVDLFLHWEEKKRLGRAAYDTIKEEWNSEHAAKELLRFADSLLQGVIEPAEKGPLSAAPIIRPGRGIVFS